MYADTEKVQELESCRTEERFHLLPLLYLFIFKVFIKSEHNRKADIPENISILGAAGTYLADDGL
jgi:hypothetical protein